MGTLSLVPTRKVASSGPTLSCFNFSKISKTKAKINFFINSMLDNGLNNVIKKTQLSTFNIEKAFRLSKFNFFYKKKYS